LGTSPYVPPPARFLFAACDLFFKQDSFYHTGLSDATCNRAHFQPIEKSEYSRY